MTSSDIQKFTNKNKSDNVITIYDVLVLFAERIKLIILIPTILCLISILYVLFIAKPVYKSTSKIISSGNKTNLNQMANIASQFGLQISSGQQEQTFVYTDIIKSKIIAGKILERRFSTKEFGQNKTLLQIITYGNQEPEFGIDTLKIIGIEKFIEEMLSVSQDMKTGIFTITISTHDPHLSKEVNDALINEIDLHQKLYNNKVAKKTRIFIQKRISETKLDLEKAEVTLKEFSERNRRIENSFLLQMEAERLRREVSVLTGVFTTLKQQLETTKIEEVRDSDYVIVLDPPSVPLEKSKPQRKLIVILTGIFGLAISFMIILFMHYYNSINSSDHKKIKKIKKSILKNIK